MADDKKKGPQPKAIVDTSIVDPKRIEELRAQARKKIEKERQLLAEKQLLEQFENEERQTNGLDEPLIDVVIDLAPYADRIRLDGVVYFQGHSYTVKESVAAVMAEMCANTWKHQSEIDGKSENFYRKSRGVHVTPAGVVSNILRA